MVGAGSKWEIRNSHTLLIGTEHSGGQDSKGKGSWLFKMELQENGCGDVDLVRFKVQ
jgi:hypothetical protein